jgi:hypothetical protein
MPERPSWPEAVCVQDETADACLWSSWDKRSAERLHRSVTQIVQGCLGPSLIDGSWQQSDHRVDIVRIDHDGGRMDVKLSVSRPEAAKVVSPQP